VAEQPFTGDPTMATMTPSEVETIKPTFNAMMGPLGELYGRWLDEQEYEDIQEYGAVLKRWLSERIPGAEFAGVTRRPFGFKFRPGPGGALYHMTTTTRKARCVKIG
jgi:hypothetical protein